MPVPQNGLHIIEGAENNIPDIDAFKASKLIETTVKTLGEDTDLLLVLISGGGSALLPSPICPLSLQEKAKITKDLSKAEFVPLLEFCNKFWFQ